MNCDVEFSNIQATCTKSVLDGFVTIRLHKTSNLCACSHLSLLRTSACHASQSCKENIMKRIRFDNFAVFF